MPILRTARTRSGLVITTLILAILTLFAGCRDEEEQHTPPAVTADATVQPGTPLAVQPTLTPTQTLTPSPTNTPRPTATPTITPTPTATAQPVVVNGNPLSVAARDPSPQAGAPCGVMDTLDFPLDPPDALNVARGGQDFGVFRNRYDGYHTGEDWWGPGGRRGSFGEPVYSIGHGQVTFAHPYGWGIDQGTVILRHVYPDGREFYSFYGHLDPPSVELLYGQCVRRGEKVGEIGRPRSSPHLHFEIRAHTPMDPGPGYWSHDPTRSGWVSPSQTIWNRRMGTSPGVLWLRPYSEPGIQGAGLWDGAATLLTIANVDLLGLDAASGGVTWRYTFGETELGPDDEIIPPVGAHTFDAVEPILYMADRSGRISAVRLPDPDADETAGDPGVIPLWDLQLHDVRGAPHLVPLPSGGVVLMVQRRMIAFTAAGALLWREPFEAQPGEWLTLQDSVLLSASGADEELWQVSADGLQPWPMDRGGHLAQTSDGVFLYDGQAVYKLDTATQEASLFYDLADGLVAQGDLLALTDGGLLLAHMDSGNRRLMALDGKGELRWERAYGDVMDGAPTLLLSGGQPYLFDRHENGSWTNVALYAIDSQTARLTWIFGGGTRDPAANGTFILDGQPGQFIINIGGGSLVAFDADLARQTVCGGGC